MAGSGRKVFAPGEVLTATNVQDYLMDQAVQVYAGSSSRGSAIGSATTEGMVSWLSDQDKLQVAVGTASWQNVSLAESPNAVINGGFDVWQRGTTFGPTTTNNLYTADRWKVTRASGQTYTVNRGTFDGTEPSLELSGEHFFEVSWTGTWTGTYWVQQNIEDVRTFAGKTVTLSFWAKASAPYSKLKTRLSQNFGTGGSSFKLYDSGNLDFTTTWQKFSFTTTLDSMSGKTVGTDSYLAAYLYYGDSSATDSAGITFSFANFQLEEGSVATPFRRIAPSLQGEIAACQRYYYRKTSASTDGIFATGFAVSTTSTRTFLPFPVEMRTTPSTTLDWTGTNANYRILYLNTAAAISATPTIDASTGPSGVKITASVASGLTAGQGIMLASSAANIHLGFSAEL
jgi:hypothetical protein